MKSLLLPVLASVSLTGAAFSQGPDQPHRDHPKPQPGPDAQHHRREDARDSQRRPPAHGALAPAQRRDDHRHHGPAHRHDSQASHHHHGPPPYPPGPRMMRPPGPPNGPAPVDELRNRVRALEQQVRELREMVMRQRGGHNPQPQMHSSPARRPSNPPVSHHRRPNPDQPRRDDAPRHDAPHPEGTRAPQGNPPPPR